jgi:hypothetical protein
MRAVAFQNVELLNYDVNNLFCANLIFAAAAAAAAAASRLLQLL